MAMIIHIQQESARDQSLVPSHHAPLLAFRFHSLALPFISPTSISVLFLLLLRPTRAQSEYQSIDHQNVAWFWSRARAISREESWLARFVPWHLDGVHAAPERASWSRKDGTNDVGSFEIFNGTQLIHYITQAKLRIDITVPPEFQSVVRWDGGREWASSPHNIMQKPGMHTRRGGGRVTNPSRCGAYPSHFFLPTCHTWTSKGLGDIWGSDNMKRVLDYCSTKSGIHLWGQRQDRGHIHTAVIWRALGPMPMASILCQRSKEEEDRTARQYEIL